MTEFKNHKEELKQIKRPDAFMARGRELVMAGLSHKGILGGVVFSALGIYLAVWFYQTQNSKKLDSAFTLYHQADKAGEKWRVASQDLESTLQKIKEIESKPQEPKDTKATSNSNEIEGLKIKSADLEKKEIELKEKYISELRTIQKSADQFPNIVKILTLNNLAQIQIKEKKWDEALNNLKAAAAFAGTSDLIISPIYHSIAFCLEEKGDYQNALEWTQKNLSLREPFSKPEILLVQARLYRLLGQKDKAKTIYEQIIKDFAGTEFENKSNSYLNLIAL